MLTSRHAAMQRGLYSPLRSIWTSVREVAAQAAVTFPRPLLLRLRVAAVTTAAAVQRDRPIAWLWYDRVTARPPGDHPPSVTERFCSIDR